MAERTASALLAIAIAAACCLACAPSEPAPPPNLLVLVVDDLGWNEPGFMGSDFFETPAIDRLAADGMVFSDAYACASTCSPSRACILSGQYTPRHGLLSVPLGPRPSVASMRLVPPISEVGLRPEVRTLAEALAGAGYDTGMFGKWHLGKREAMSPAAAGFDVVGLTDRRGPPPPDDPRWSGAITDALLEFIRHERDRPFFAYVGYVAVHAPGAAREERIAAFREKPAGALHRDPLQAAMLAELDDQVGRVIDELSALGLAENTLVVLTSDNGGRAVREAKPFRGAKGGYEEGGIRVPLVMRWPGFVEAGSRSAWPTSNIDFYPTLLELANGSLVDGQIIDGASLVPVLRGEQPKGERALFWHAPFYGSRSEPVSIVRRGRHKLVLAHEPWLLEGGRAAIETNGAVRLFDLTNDPEERHDLAAAQPAVRDALLDELLAWIDRVEAALPKEPRARRSDRAR